MLPVAAELVRRGNMVRFYSFAEFEEKIKATGAEYISCDSFLPKLTKQEEVCLKKGLHDRNDNTGPSCYVQYE